MKQQNYQSFKKSGRRLTITLQSYKLLNKEMNKSYF